MNNPEALYAFVASTGISLVHILDTDELFAFTSFTPAEGLLKKHTLSGRDASTFFHQNSATMNYGNAETQKSVTLTKIMSLPLVRREYSHDIKWTTYLAM